MAEGLNSAAQAFRNMIRVHRCRLNRVLSDQGLHMGQPAVLFALQENPRATQRAIDLLACGAVDAGALISAEISLNDFPAEIVSREHIKHGKVIVRIE